MTRNVVFNEFDEQKQAAAREMVKELHEVLAGKDVDICEAALITAITSLYMQDGDIDAALLRGALTSGSVVRNMIDCMSKQMADEIDVEQAKGATKQ